MRGKDIPGRSDKFKDLKMRKSRASLGTCGWFHVRTHWAKLVFAVVVGTCPRGVRDDFFKVFN